MYALGSDMMEAGYIKGCSNGYGWYEIVVTCSAPQIKYQTVNADPVKWIVASDKRVTVTIPGTIHTLSAGPGETDSQRNSVITYKDVSCSYNSGHSGRTQPSGDCCSYTQITTTTTYTLAVVSFSISRSENEYQTNNAPIDIHPIEPSDVSLTSVNSRWINSSNGNATFMPGNGIKIYPGKNEYTLEVRDGHTSDNCIRRSESGASLPHVADCYTKVTKWIGLTNEDGEYNNFDFKIQYSGTEVTDKDFEVKAPAKIDGVKSDYVKIKLVPYAIINGSIDYNALEKNGNELNWYANGILIGTGKNIEVEVKIDEIISIYLDVVGIEENNVVSHWTKPKGQITLHTCYATGSTVCRIHTSYTITNHPTDDYNVPTGHDYKWVTCEYSGCNKKVLVPNGFKCTAKTGATHECYATGSITCKRSEHSGWTFESHDSNSYILPSGFNQKTVKCEYEGCDRTVVVCDGFTCIAKTNHQHYAAGRTNCNVYGHEQWNLSTHNKTKYNVPSGYKTTTKKCEYPGCEVMITVNDGFSCSESSGHECSFSGSDTCLRVGHTGWSRVAHSNHVLENQYVTKTCSCGRKATVLKGFMCSPIVAEPDDVKNGTFRIISVRDLAYEGNYITALKPVYVTDVRDKVLKDNIISNLGRKTPKFGYAVEFALNTIQNVNKLVIETEVVETLYDVRGNEIDTEQTIVINRGDNKTNSEFLQREKDGLWMWIYRLPANASLTHKYDGNITVRFKSITAYTDDDTAIDYMDWWSRWIGDTFEYDGSRNLLEDLDNNANS